MNCKKCGTELIDNADFCIKCGEKVNQKKSSKVKIVGIVVMFLCIFITGLIYYNKFNSIVVEGRYYSMFSEGFKESYLDFYPLDKGQNIGNYKEIIFESSDSVGNILEYMIKDDIITLNSLIGETDYKIYKNYLVPLDYSYTGEIPKDKDTFDVICSSEYTKIIFSQDGTVMVDENNGTYERDGELIRIKGIGKYNLLYLVYENHINDSVYYKEE